jgi:hypothetical protein
LHQQLLPSYDLELVNGLALFALVFLSHGGSLLSKGFATRTLSELGREPLLPFLQVSTKGGASSAGGCNDSKVLPEINPMNYVSHVKIPVLMLNGRYDFEIPLDTCQEPFFRLLGTSPQNKRHILFDSGHAAPYTPVFKETLNWLDHYLGSVK